MSADLREVLGQKIERSYLSNLDTGRTEPMLFNPEELTERYGGQWVRHESPGMTSQRLQWTGGLNATYPLTVAFDQVTFTRRNGGPNTSEGITGAESWRRFLISLSQANRGQKIKATEPSPVLFYWPDMISIQCRVLTVEITHKLFAAGSARPRYYVAQIELEEDAEERVYAQDVLDYGTIRATRQSRIKLP